MKRDLALSTVDHLLQSEYEVGLKDGIAQGVQAAERILAWFLANPKLVDPEQLETLEEWSRETIAKLRAKL